MTAALLRVSPATVAEATKASSPVAAVVAAMRRIDPAGGAVSAGQVRAWAETLLTELYSATPVRWEYRHKDDHRPGCWMEADAGHVYGGHQRGLVVRALFETPRVRQPEKEHSFQGRVCVRCGDSEDWAGPDCSPLVKKVDPRTRLPFNPEWLIEPLKWLRDARPNLNQYDRRKRSEEAAFLLGQLEAHIEECKKP